MKVQRCGFGFRHTVTGNVNLVLLKPLTLKYARCPGRNNKALEIKYDSRGLFFWGGPFSFLILSDSL